MGLSMDCHPDVPPTAVLQGSEHATAGSTRNLHTPPATILIVALWIGLTAGFLDLGLMILKKRLIGDDFSRLGDHFYWIIPTGVGLLLLLPGAALALIACFRRRRVSLGSTVGLLAFVGYLDACSRLPLEFWSVAPAVGRPCRPIRLVGRCPP